MKVRLHAVIAIIAAFGLFALAGQRPARAWNSDNGNGTFTNPVLNADYPDPDIIRVGSDFYLVTTTFVSIPGLEILHSKDLINWDIAGYAINSIGANSQYSLTGGSEYGNGVWAPSLRYRNGTFYIVDNIQSVGTVVLRATSPSGPWTQNTLNGYLFDPSLVFDDDGTPLVYHGTGGNVSVAVLDAGLNTVLSDTPAYSPGQGAEGSHAYKVNGTFYVFNAVFGQYPIILCSRSTQRNGPFSTVTVCNNGTPWASPHQGGMVQLENGDWWGFSLNEAGALGRDLWIGPINWSNGWPYFGNPAAPSIPNVNNKPNVGANYPISHVPTSDEFSGPALGAQWQWNHNPDNSKWSLSTNPGNLTLFTETAPNYPNSRNTLTLRTEGPACTGVIKIDTSNLQPGDRAGLSLLEQYFGYIAVYKDAGGQRIVRVVNSNGSLTAPSEEITNTVYGVTNRTLWLQAHCDFGSGNGQFSYSTDGVNFTQLGGNMPLHFTLTTFQGDRFGIFAYNPNGSGGRLDVDYFRQDGIVGSTATDPLIEGDYEISPVDAPNQCLDVYDVLSAPGTLVDQYYWGHGPGQIFHAHPLGSGVYWFEPRNAPGLALDVYGGGGGNYSQIDIYSYYGQPNQRWTVTPGTSGFRLSPLSAPAYALDQPGGYTTPGLDMQLYSAMAGDVPQLWNFVNQPPIGHCIGIRSTTNNLYVTNNLNNSVDTMGAYWATSIQAWEKFNVVDAGNNLIALKSLSNGDYVSTNLGNNDYLQAAWATSINSWEQYQWVGLTPGTFALKSIGSGYYVTANVNNGGQLTADHATSPLAWETFTWTDLGPAQ